jgi:hypothetical protein
MRFENQEEQTLWDRRNPRPGQVMREVRRKQPAASRPLPAMLSDVVRAVSPATRGQHLDQRSAAVKAYLGWVRFEALAQGRRRGEWAAWPISPKGAGPKRKGCNVRKGEKA